MCHKLGSCPIGDISVVIAVSSEHRAEALEAVDYAINELKRSVVIWKKEVYENGQAAWKENVEQFSSSCVDDGKHRTIHTTFVETVESEVDVKTGHSNDNANASTNIVSKRSSISLSIVDFQRDADVDARVSTTGDNIHLKPMDSI